MKIGDSIKVHLPGESPWADVVAIHDDGTWDGKIVNLLLPEFSDKQWREVVARHGGKGDGGGRIDDHGYRQNDIVRFRLRKERDFTIWEAVERVKSGKPYPEMAGFRAF